MTITNKYMVKKRRDRLKEVQYPPEVFFLRSSIIQAVVLITS